MRFQEPTKWELFLDGFHVFMYAWECYDDEDYRAFWEALSSGWYAVSRIREPEILLLGQCKQRLSLGNGVGSSLGHFSNWNKGT